MPHERLGKLERQTNEHNQKIGLLENGLDSIKGLTEKLEKLTEAMISNTHSNREVMKMQERLIKRQDATEKDSRSIHDELAEARPIIKMMSKVANQSVPFAVFMIALLVAMGGYVIKG